MLSETMASARAGVRRADGQASQGGAPGADGLGRPGQDGRRWRAARPPPGWPPEPCCGVLLRGHRRPRLMGMPMPRSNEVKAGARQAVRAGRRLYEVQTDVRLLREQAERSRRQSPIEVLLSGLDLAHAAARSPRRAPRRVRSMSPRRVALALSVLVLAAAGPAYAARAAAHRLARARRPVLPAGGQRRLRRLALRAGARLRAFHRPARRDGGHLARAPRGRSRASISTCAAST